MNGHYKNGINHSNANGSGIETSENKEFIYLKRLYSLILRFKWLIILSVILFTSGAYYLAFYHLLPQYESAAVVTIDAGNNNPGANFNVANALLPDRYVMGKSIEADIQFLTSRDLLNKVASQLVNLRDEEDLSKFPILWSNFPEDSSAASVDAVTGRLGSGISIGQSPKSEEILNVSFTGYSPQEASRITNLYLNVALESRSCLAHQCA